ncbi:MAG: hypothetical protein ABSF38_18290 [Verrucomicrobiota bacterium]|jgi:hypothetical protein
MDKKRHRVLESEEVFGGALNMAREGPALLRSASYPHALCVEISRSAGNSRQNGVKKAVKRDKSGGREYGIILAENKSNRVDTATNKRLQWLLFSRGNKQRL